MAHRVHVKVHIGNKTTAGGTATATKSTKTKSGRSRKSGGKRKTPSGPKRLGKLKGGLRAYWAARGVKP